MTPAETDTSQRSVLVVDDESHLTFMLSRKLKARGIAVDAARNGQEGLKKALASPPDLIVTDYQMPGMDGHAMCVALAEEEATAEVPILMLTGRGHKLALSDLVKTNVRELLAKPFSMNDLIAKIEATLGETSASSSGMEDAA